MPRSLSVLFSVLVLGMAPPSIGEPLFEDRTAETGLEFVHTNGMTGKLFYPEVMGAGGALFDYDGDGDLDLYLMQGRVLDPERSSDRALPSRVEGEAPRDRLFRNDLDRHGDPFFREVAASARIRAFEYGQALAVGDLEGDGDPDLYLANFGRDELWENLGDGTFREISRERGVGDPGWSSAATFVDIDSDGLLDLLVVRYVDWSVDENPTCYTSSSRPDYCGPDSFRGLRDRLWRQRPDGSFLDVSVSSGVGIPEGPGLGAFAGDIDEDGDPDLVVANDGRENFLWRNRGDGTFEEDALLAGIAVNREGRPEASMGIAAGDPDEDRDLDLLFTHLAQETNTLYVSHDGLFDDRTPASGLGPPSLPYTGFGTVWLDADGDGRLDLAVVNGAVEMGTRAPTREEPFPLQQPNQLFLQTEDLRFREMPLSSPPSPDAVSRGLSLGDVNLDRVPDLLIANDSGPARLLVGTRPGTSGVAIAVVDPGGRVLTGTRGRFRTEEGPELHARISTDGSYASASAPWMLREIPRARRVDVRLDSPGRGPVRFLGLPTDRGYRMILEGSS